jgi:hypothetical protein
MQELATLSEAEQQSFLGSLSEQQIKELAWQWAGWQARPNQVAPPGDWRYWLVKAGRGFGKTRVGAEWVREQVKSFERVALIGKDAGDMRSVMIEGESGIMAVCPPWERPEYLPTRRMLRWPNGAISEFRTGEDPEGVRGLQCERLWADEIAAWQYPLEAWQMALLGLRLGDDPRACVTTTPKPIPLLRELVENPHCVVTHGSTYDNVANLAPAFADEIILQFEGTRLGRQELEGELLDDEGLAYAFRVATHVVAPFEVPAPWERFEHMDYGLSAPTAWYVQATDFDGNQIVFDGLYEPGLPSEIGPKIKARRDRSWTSRAPGARPNRCFADPAIWAAGARTKWGRPASVADEFLSDCGIQLERGNNDRRAGHVRIAELLRCDEQRRFPRWHPRAGEPGAPRLFIMETAGTRELIDQLLWAPVEDEGKPLAGEAVDADWERSRGHAHASLRYGVLSRPKPSSEPPPENVHLIPPLTGDEMRAIALAEREAKLNSPARRRRYVLS